MPLRNTPTRFGWLTKGFHWVTAALIVFAFVIGWLAHEAPFETAEDIALKAQMFTIHKTTGVAIFFVALARIFWAVSQVKPALLNADRKLESLVAEIVHWLLYASLVTVPLSGWIHHAATTGFAPIWWPFGQSLPFVPKDAGVAEISGALHKMFIVVLAISIALHVAGALKHHVIDRDLTLRRMLPGKAEGGDPRKPHPKLVPMAAAALVLVGTLVMGALSGAFQATVAVTDRGGLEAVQSDWVVRDGTLSISVRQMGSDVEGTFSDWTAEIKFEDKDTDQPIGTVNVTILISSLTLGSVTKEALNADYLNAQEHPKAFFEARIFRVDDGFEARGDLKLLNVSVPVTLPFTLTMDGKEARMTGKTSIDRMAFGVGSKNPDESSLGHAVTVSVALNAIRQE